MEAEISENNVSNCVPEMEITKVGVSENTDVPQEAKPDSTDKELSWEKIAAEIAAEEEDQTPESQLVTESTSVVSESTTEAIVSESTAEGVVSESTTREVQETVINIVTEQKIVAEEDSAEKQEASQADTSDVITSSTETITETEARVEVSTTESVPAPAPAEYLPIEESTSKDEVVPEPESTEAEAVEAHNAKKQIVEIREVRADESVEVAETIDEIEYTVVEAEDAETNEIIEEHVAQSTSETVVIINPDHTQTEITIEQMEEGGGSEDSSQDSYTEEIYVLKEGEEFIEDAKGKEKSKSKKPRGRKSMGEIPLHVLGRDITKPTEGVTNGGRVMPKPRLGVKVPYRNLTSQIVSKADIEKEIMDRFKQKQEQNAQNAADLMFARKLTQRLAKKLGPGEKKVLKELEAAGTSTKENSESEIKNNSDLIAILEGDDEEIPPPPVIQEPVKLTEREIALKQLEELPLKSLPKPTKPKVEEKEREKEKEKVVVPKDAKPKVAPPADLPQKPAEKKEVEPRLKTGMVIKTYTRKRKSFDMEPFLSPKKTAVATVKTEEGIPSDAYITKSSRVIKRKVIWDPDETPSKSPVKIAKVEQPVKSSPKVVEKKEAQISKPVSPVKKPISKSPILKKPKRLTEVDKLLMDEGAVNMLYDVNNTDEPSPKKKNKSVINLDKAHKELMSKANLLKNDFQQNSPNLQKSLRKKEIPSPTSAKKEMKKEAMPSPVTRKKSKDSSRSTPPPSPGFNSAEASRIIRRHSSSSFSSDGEMDEDEEDESEAQEEEAEAKPKKKAEITPKKKIKKSEKTKEVAKVNNNTTEAKPNHVDKTVGQYKVLNVTKKNKLVHIKLLNSEGKCFLKEQVLKELTSCFKDLGKDDDCHVVSLTSDSSESFCEGLDYSALVVEDDAARKKKANELANLVKEFLRCLLNFPKVLVAGIQGQCVGLGVTMLPLFDMVIASDTSTFSAPYSDLGSVPEAGFLLTVPHLTNNGLASELFYASQKIKAEDAFRRGLISRLCWPEKYQQELKSILSQTANQSRQSLMATKQQLRQHLMQSTDSALNSITKVLVEYWISPECQANFAK